MKQGDTVYIKLHDKVIKGEFDERFVYFKELAVSGVNIDERLYRENKHALTFFAMRCDRLAEKLARRIIIKDEYILKVIKYTKLARKMYPNAIEKEGWLLV